MAHQDAQCFTREESFANSSIFQDVVPVNEDALPNWNYPPFSGYYDGMYCDLRQLSS
jgi:hypothetical protein